MFLLYIDASGTPQLQDTQTKNYVLTGICVHEGTWFALDRRIQGLKRNYACLPGEDFELHAKDFAKDFSEQGQVPDFEKLDWQERRARIQTIRQQRLMTEADPPKKAKLETKYRHTHPFIHLSRQERSRLLEDALDLVGEHEGLRLFGEAISKTHPAVRGGRVDPVTQAFEQLLARFDAFLTRRHQWLLQKNPRAKMNNGLLIMDRDRDSQLLVDGHFRKYRSQGHTWGELRHVIDIPFFAASEQLHGLQLVDICAFAVRRYLDTEAVKGSHEESNFLRIFHRFHREGKGRLHGLRHYVPAGTCSCLICQERGHSLPLPLTTPSGVPPVIPPPRP